jgi:hypothetical protein
MLSFTTGATSYILVTEIGSYKRADIFSVSGSTVTLSLAQNTLADYYNKFTTDSENLFVCGSSFGTSTYPIYAYKLSNLVAGAVTQATGSQAFSMPYASSSIEGFTASYISSSTTGYVALSQYGAKVYVCSYTGSGLVTTTCAALTGFSPMTAPSDATTQFGESVAFASGTSILAIGDSYVANGGKTKPGAVYLYDVSKSAASALLATIYGPNDYAYFGKANLMTMGPNALYVASSMIFDQNYVYGYKIDSSATQTSKVAYFSMAMSGLVTGADGSTLLSYGVTGGGSTYSWQTFSVGSDGTITAKAAKNPDTFAKKILLGAPTSNVLAFSDYSNTNSNGIVYFENNVADPPSISPVSSPTSSSSSVCFASSETVELADGSIKAISEVQLGDRVLTASLDGTASGFSPVVAIPHAGDVSTKTTFTQLTMESGVDVRMTPDHLLLAGSCSATKLPLVQASSVRVGDCLQTAFASKQIVTKTAAVPGQGIGSVVTAAGGLVVVNGIVASPFAINHAIPEAWYSIHRLVYSVFPASLGFKLFQQTSERFGDLSVQFSL